MMNEDWIIEEDFEQNGEHHMARDEALARDRISDTALPSILRLYSWRPAAISLGYQQPMESVNLDACREHGIEVVRRPTGGRAVLHKNELTYAIITRTSPAEGLYAVHNRMVQSLLSSLASLPSYGTIALPQVTPRSQKTVLPVACFASAARHEVTWDGKKVIGSAQRRFGEVVLQHGSILLSRDHQLLPELLALPEASRKDLSRILERETATLADVFGREISIEESARAIRENFVANYLSQSELIAAV